MKTAMQQLIEYANNILLHSNINANLIVAKAKKLLEEENKIIEDEAVGFAEWIEDNKWVVVYSEELNKRAYVDASKEKVLLHGSDYHYTTLVRERGKSLIELFQLYKNRKA